MKERHVNHLMNYFREYALLVAVAIPLLAIVGMNVYLWWGGERGTLLLPSSLRLPKVLDTFEIAEEPMPVGCEAAPAITVADPALAAAVPANDVHERQVA
jgi:hypothetical protein